MEKIGIITGEAADLPEELTEKYQIEIVKYPVWFPDEDKEEIKDRGTLYQKMRVEKKLPQTSHPSFIKFKQAYQKALEKFDKVLVISLSKEFSGTFDSAVQAKQQMNESEQERIEIFDSYLASVAKGLVVLKAQELINQEKKLPEILGELTEFRKKVKLFAFIEDLTWLIQGGRLRKPWTTPALILQKMRIRPAIGIVNGKVKMTGLEIFTEDQIQATLKELKRVSRKGKIKVAIAHAGLSEKDIVRLKDGVKKINGELLFVSELTLSVGAHTGPGTIITAYYFE